MIYQMIMIYKHVALKWNYIVVLQLLVTKS